MAGTWCRPAGRAQPAAGRKQGRRDLFSSFLVGGGTIRILLPLILLLLPIAAQAATYHVNPDGSGDYTTIAAALAAASTGDTIIVQGEYTPVFLSERTAYP
jgi:hypothetical protein